MDEPPLRELVDGLDLRGADVSVWLLLLICFVGLAVIGYIARRFGGKDSGDPWDWQ